MKVRKIFVYILALVFILSLCACDVKVDDPIKDDTSDSSQSVPSALPSPTQAPSEESVSIFSDNGEMGGYTFKLEPVNAADADADAGLSYTSCIGNTCMKNGSTLWPGSFLGLEYIINSASYEDNFIVVLSYAETDTAMDIESVIAAIPLEANGEYLYPIVAWYNKLVILAYDTDISGALGIVQRGDLFSLCLTDAEPIDADPTVVPTEPEPEGETFTITGIDVAGLMKGLSGRDTITLIGTLGDGTEVYTKGDPKLWFENAEVSNLSLPENSQVGIESQQGGLWAKYLIIDGGCLEATAMFDGTEHHFKLSVGLSFSCTVDETIVTLNFDHSICE